MNSKKLFNIYEYGNLIASGSIEQCAAKLGKSVDATYGLISRSRNGRTKRYTFDETPIEEHRLTAKPIRKRKKKDQESLPIYKDLIFRLMENNCPTEFGYEVSCEHEDCVDCWKQLVKGKA